MNIESVLTEEQEVQRMVKAHTPEQLAKQVLILAAVNEELADLLREAEEAK